MKILILTAFFIATVYSYPNGFYENANSAYYVDRSSGISSFIPVENSENSYEPPVVVLRRARRDADYEITPHVDSKDGVQNAGVVVERKTENHDTKVYWNKDTNRRGKPNWGVGGQIRW